MNIITPILREAARDEKLNIIVFNTHERYETHLCETGHNFYAWNAQNLKKWKTDFAPIPKNYFQLDEKLGASQLPWYVDFDLVISQNKFGQYQIASQIAKQLRLPLISFEHTLPIEMWPAQQKKNLVSMKGDVNIFLSEFSKNAWNWDTDYTIIPAAVDTDFFTPNGQRENVALSVVNDWKERDYFCGYYIWERTIAGLPYVVRGINKGLSEPTKSPEELREVYRRSRIFYNTSQVSSCPYTLLEAMSCGCAVVSTATTMIPSFIEDGVNGFISNDERELRAKLELLLNDEELATRLGQKARETVIEKFSLPNFVKNWNNVLGKI